MAASSLIKLDARARSLPDPVLLAAGLAAVAGLATFKATVGRSVPIADFFLVPVAAVAWFARRRVGAYAAAVITAAITIAVSLHISAAHVEAIVTAGAARLVLYLVAVAVLRAMRALQEEHEHEAASDDLTGLANARAFRAVAQAEIRRAQRYGGELSLAYLDIDDFKAINDRVGHPEGDRVLLKVAHLMRHLVRRVDCIARLGGDEFAVLMPQTGAGEARALVDRLRGELGRLHTADGHRILCSVGLVTFTESPARPQDLIEAGDRLMYRAKRNGRDRVEQRLVEMRQEVGAPRLAGRRQA